MRKIPIASLVLAGGLVLSTQSLAFAATANDIIKSGQQYLGKPYVYGAAIGDVNEFDCSSFTATIFKENGLTLPRTASQQSQIGIGVQKGDLQAGDLVFFDTDFSGAIDHVGIYIGGGQMISALLTGVSISNVNSSYWTQRYVTARRLLGVQTASTPGTASDPTNYTVTSGDSLWSISQKFGISISDLKSINQLTSDLIRPGQKLTLSDNKATATQPATTTTAETISTPTTKTSLASSTSKTTYKVESGDSLWKIAQRFNLSVSQLEAINKLKSDLIYPGQSLTVKTNPSPATTTQPVTIPIVNKNTASSPKTTTLVDSTTMSNQTTAKDQAVTYVVKKGDTLSAIAYKEGITLSELKSLNKITSYLIYPGQKLTIKKSSSSTKNQSSTLKIASVQEPTQVTYTVKKGDTLWDIALLNDTNTKSLMKNNNLSSPFIFPGQKLVL